MWLLKHYDWWLGKPTANTPLNEKTSWLIRKIYILFALFSTIFLKKWLIDASKTVTASLRNSPSNILCSFISTTSRIEPQHIFWKNSEGSEQTYQILNTSPSILPSGFKVVTNVDDQKLKENAIGCCTNVYKRTSKVESNPD